MGTTYLFKCNEWQYETQVDGGLSGGMFCRTATVSCQMCKQLFDVVFWASESMDEPVSMEEEEPEAFECPKGHPAKRWDDPGTCPRCGAIMLKERRSCSGIEPYPISFPLDFAKGLSIQ